MKNIKHKLLLELSYETNEDSYTGHGDAESVLLNTIKNNVNFNLVDDDVIENFKIEKANKIFKVDFEGVQSFTNNCLIISAKNIKEARKIASETIKHTKEFTVKEVIVNKSGVIVYLNGDF